MSTCVYMCKMNRTLWLANYMVRHRQCTYSRLFSLSNTNRLQRNVIGKLARKPVNLKMTSVFQNVLDFKEKVAVRDVQGRYTYGQILAASHQLAAAIENKIGDLKQQKVAFLCPNDITYVVTQWACWLNRQIAVPLSPIHPAAMLEYFINDSQSNLIVTTPKFLPILEEISKKLDIPVLVFDSTSIQSMISSGESNRNDTTGVPKEVLDTLADNLTETKDNGNILSSSCIGKFKNAINNHPNDDGALIIYTSGSTGKPKGVLISHKNLCAQVNSMVEAWQWSSSDSILHCLPLHHVHGVVNALLVPLMVGARCVMLPSFEASEVWKQFLGVKLSENERVNMFTGVPTMYIKLLDKYTKSLAKNERMVEYIRESCLQKMRVFMSGSAPLPVQIFEKWKSITGHKILERYGMTETGMILTNSLNGDRRPGSVGIPFPGVSVRIVDSNGTVLCEGTSKSTIIMEKGGKNKAVSGELLVKGDNVFKQYYLKSTQTEEAFVNGWFKTGDCVQYEVVADNKVGSIGEYKILGRQSVDIIKTGGYKVSAIHVETVLRDHPQVNDVAVVGVSDLTWGQRVVAIIETVSEGDLDSIQLKTWAKSRLPPYEVPTQIHLVKSIPRNALGKVNKKDLVNVVFNKGNGKC